MSSSRGVDESCLGASANRAVIEAAARTASDYHGPAARMPRDFAALGVCPAFLHQHSPSAGSVISPVFDEDIAAPEKRAWRPDGAMTELSTTFAARPVNGIVSVTRGVVAAGSDRAGRRHPAVR
ncbi:hypothetical protein [Nocardia wallacei]|uniref:hypothetical protein n=1 Tax=Nocardia wallacei TaxID=480035 RepID=UPI002458EB93|nr:hypothetical protein [Nocardia wallacei]